MMAVTPTPRRRRLPTAPRGSIAGPAAAAIDPLAHFPASLRAAWHARGIAAPWTDIQQRAWDAGLAHLPNFPAMTEGNAEAAAAGEGTRASAAAASAHSPLAWVASAPTSAGKSFIAEVMAAAQLLAPDPARRRALWLVPTRALAHTLTASLAPTFATQGWRVASLTGEEPPSDPLAPAHLTIAVYERWFATLLGEPDPAAALDAFGLLIADELGLLRDAERGPRLLAWLAMLPHRAPGLRRLGLMPPAPDADELARAWDARLLASTQRPHALHCGTVDLAHVTFSYQPSHAPQPPHTEVLLPPGEWDAALAPWTAALMGADAPATITRALEAHWLALATALARRGEPTLLFAPTRAAARRWTTLLIMHGSLPAAGADWCARARALAAADPIADHVQLSAALAAGVAIHHADLTAPARRLVEAAAAATDGPRLLVATPTLAQGINLPMRNVLHWPWQFADGAAASRSGLRPLEGWRLADQAGRAGRHGLCSGPGRSLWPAGLSMPLPACPTQAEPVMALPPDPTWFTLVAAALDCPRAATASPLAPSAAALELRHRELTAAGWLAEDRLAPPGELALRLGLGGEQVTHLQALARLAAAPWDASAPPSPARLLPWLAALALALPADELPGEPARRHPSLARAATALLAASTPGVAHADPPTWFADALLAPLGDSTLLPAGFACASVARRAAALAFALRMLQWIGPRPTEAIERDTGWSSGRLARSGEMLGRLAAALGRMLGESPNAPDSPWSALAWRLQRGAVRSLHEHLGWSLPALPRRTWQQLAASADADLPQLLAPSGNLPLSSDDRAALCAALDRQRQRAAAFGDDVPGYALRLVRGLHHDLALIAEPTAAHTPSTQPPPSRVLLEIDLKSPCLVKAAGCALHVHPLGFDLLVALAEAPGSVLTRDALYSKLWPGDDGGPEDQQLDAHRRKLGMALARTLGAAASAPLIEVLRGTGFRLALEPDQVLLHR